MVRSLKSGLKGRATWSPTALPFTPTPGVRGCWVLPGDAAASLLSWSPAPDGYRPSGSFPRGSRSPTYFLCTLPLAPPPLCPLRIGPPGHPQGVLCRRGGRACQMGPELSCTQRARGGGLSRECPGPSAGRQPRPGWGKSPVALQRPQVPRLEAWASLCRGRSAHSGVWGLQVISAECQAAGRAPGTGKGDEAHFGLPVSDRNADVTVTCSSSWNHEEIPSGVGETFCSHLEEQM